MLVKSDYISKLVIKSEALNCKTSLANEKESFLVYLLFVSGLSNWSQNSASLQVGVPIADKIVLASPYRTSALEPFLVGHVENNMLELLLIGLGSNGTITRATNIKQNKDTIIYKNIYLIIL